jgi:cytochrome c553
MQGIAGGLSDADMQVLATYYAGLHGRPAPPADPPEPNLVAMGAQLAEAGRPSTATPACFSCHGAGGRGVGARFPGLAGQPAAFVVKRLHEFQARAKATTPAPGTMSSVAAQLDEAQIRQAAAYLSTLPPP